jgi:hypothetical protein
MFCLNTQSPITRHAELLRLCARIGYSPHQNWISVFFST